MKTPNGLFSLFILLYTLILALLSPFLRKKGKNAALWVLSVLPVVCALVHLWLYGTRTFDDFMYLYIAALLPLILLLPGRSRISSVLKSAAVSLSSLAVCFIFLVNATAAPMIHNYSRYSYSDGFRKMLSTMEKEYCLSSWKHTDYDALLEEYLPQIEEAERDNDKVRFAAIITEVTCRFYDSHVSAYLPKEINMPTYEYMAGNDYGLSLARIDDGSVIAVMVEDEINKRDICLADDLCELDKIGIHNGTQILSWDGRDINEAIADVDCFFPALQYPVRSNEDAFRPFFLAGKGGESVEVTFIDDDGKEQSAELKRIGGYSNRLIWTCRLFSENIKADTNNYACMLDDRCGYLRVSREHYDTLSDNIAAVKNGYYPELTEMYAGLIGDLRSQGMEYLVIDIRDNGGGYDCCGGALASLFTDEKRHMVSFGYEDAEGYHIKENQYIFPDGRYMDIPVAALVNSECVSAGDGLAKFLSDCPNVTLMGITASSGVNQNNGGQIYLAEGICVNYPVYLSLSEDGEPLIDTDYTRENRIPLDVTIPLTKEAAMKMFSVDNIISIGSIDPDLEYAVSYLENNN